jgi:predicted ribonuclease YlaK
MEYEKNDGYGRRMTIIIPMYQIQNLESAMRKNGELAWNAPIAPHEIYDFIYSAIDEKFRELDRSLTHN